ncbi:acyl carrier protein [Nocardia mexicana]|uniref:Acyl carrier protein n=1 Tax=Nocardia mexicana TaxID=279262 RepID=A0A370GMJ7_9NOCA|nr:acyl carrier protein [Nocardia mexicana]RDI44945.1 acyl carrier protein [Nocardia mexicana]
MTDTIESVDAKVRRLIAAAAPNPVEAADLTDETQLIEDLGFESLRLMEMTMLLERAFGLPSYQPEELWSVLSVGDVVALVSGSLAGAGK